MNRLDAAGATGRVLAGHRQRVTLLEFSTDDQRIVSASKDGMVRVWDVTRAASIVTLRPKGLVTQMARFTPDGKRVLTLGAQETDARIWHADGAGGFVSLSAGRAEVNDVYASRDGGWLLATTESATASALPLDADRALHKLRASAMCLSVVKRQRYLSERTDDSHSHRAACDNEPASGVDQDR